MKLTTKALSLYCLFALFACSTNEEAINVSNIVEVESPTRTYAQTPNFFVSNSGQVYLSWIEGTESNYKLKYASYKEHSWTEPLTIAEGDNWFVNWADFPSISVRQDGSMAAHWLVMRDSGTYDYDIHIAQKGSGSSSWSSSFIPHRDSLSAEHGFVSMKPLPNGNILALWLDGRNAKSGHDGASMKHGTSAQAMTLRSAEFDKTGKLFRELEVDNRVCDCCQTDLVITPFGAVAVYRDRSDSEIRDISYAYYENGVWSPSQNLSPDNWKIKGCPVNGPAISSLGNSVATAWFTSANKQAKIQLIFSENGGKQFGKSITIPTKTALGRVDVELIDDDKALVSWLAKNGSIGEIKAVVVNKTGTISDEKVIGTTAISRLSGFPVMVKEKEGILVAWTLPEEPSIIKIVRIALN